MPVCYRHPGRETYIRCSRCDRPICPDCMVSAAVGFQCPECVAEGKRTVRAPRTVTGAALPSRPGLVTTTLIASCVVVFAVQLAVPTFTAKYWMLGVGVAAGQWYRLITAGFLHLSVVHILFNMWALWVVGRPLEDMLGRARFVGLYFACLLAGSTFSYFGNGPLTPGLGASGAIFGLFGGMLVVARRMHWNISGIVGIIVINLALPFVMHGIDWHAHVGGLVAGLAVTAVMVHAPRAFRGVAAGAACLAVVLVCALLVPVRTQQILDDPQFTGLTTVEVDQLTDQSPFRPSLS